MRPLGSDENACCSNLLSMLHAGSDPITDRHYQILSVPSADHCTVTSHAPSLPFCYKGSGGLCVPVPFSSVPWASCATCARLVASSSLPFLGTTCAPKPVPRRHLPPAPPLPAAPLPAAVFWPLRTRVSTSTHNQSSSALSLGRCRWRRPTLSPSGGRARWASREKPSCLPPTETAATGRCLVKPCWGC